METFGLSAWDDGAVHVVQVSGEFDVAGCVRFRRATDCDDVELVVIDLRDVTFIDSAAVGELISLQRRVAARRSKLAILRPGGEADRIFKLTGIDGHLPLYDERVPLLAEFNYG